MRTLIRPERRFVPTARGFSLIELVVSMSVLLLVLAGVFQSLRPGQAAMLAEPERSDIQQRARIAFGVLADDLRQAGAGVAIGARGGTLARTLPPVVPYRRGRRMADPPETFRAGTLSLVRRAESGPHTTLATNLPARSGSAAVSLDAGCELGHPACGFDTGMSVLVLDSAHHAFFSVTGVSGNVLMLTHNGEDSSHVFAAEDTSVVQVEMRTYYARADEPTETFQLIRYDGAGGADVPVVDHLVQLEFILLGDTQPPVLTQSRSAPIGPWTSYGPAPPALGVQNSSYPAGENCLFRIDAGAQMPRLDPIGPGTLVPLDSARLLDGPWCPDASDPNRYDADLLRVRAVEIRVRVEASSRQFRGPAGLLFSRGGVASPDNWLPDLEIRTTVIPRGMGGLR
jgi:prepilin-type N-terminal cleavage/methylation domain-containing protein